MREWKAKWISHVYDPRQDLGIFAFRNLLHLESAPETLPIRISADNRYKLYVNGEMIAFGPQRGDERHWFYDHFDLAAHLRVGENQIVALVWNFGWMAPMAQHTVRTAFVFDAGDHPLTTPGGWGVARIEGWDFDMMHSSIGDFYIDIGPGEIMGPIDDLLLAIDDSRVPNGKWRKPHIICDAEERGASGGGTPWMLIPRTLPPMRYEKRIAPPKIRRGFAGDDPSWATPEGATSLSDGQKILFDYEELLCAYPRLVLSGPEGAAVKLTYAEALWQPDGGKGNRHEVEGKEMRGYQDKLILGPGPTIYEPLWWRTYRYLMIEASLESGLGGPPLDAKPEQGDLGRAAPATTVTMRSIEAIETGYPLAAESTFEADDPAVKPIWEVSLRTAERCAGETYFDCPYYEQLQYVGDTRIQALIGYYLGRDRRLQRNAVETLGWSIMENGLTQSRYPSRQTQVIPPFSLWWVMMLYDQMLYDEHFQTQAEPSEFMSQAVANVVSAFKQIQKREKRGGGGFWNFGDWVPTWNWGVPPGGSNSTMHVLTCMLADMARTCVSFGASGEEFTAEPKQKRREGLEREMSRSSGLIRGRLDDAWLPSEHAEALFRVKQQLNGDAGDPWPTEALAKANAAKCTYYFSYYKHLAMFGNPEVAAGPALSEAEWVALRQAGAGDRRASPAARDYMDELQPWKEMIEDGLTTFAENPEPTRSDCHAWSAHPILGFFQVVAGVTSIAPGWKKAKIMPHPGNLKRFDARIAHPDGELRVAYEDGKLSIDTPIPFELAWHAKKETFEPGSHEI